MSDTSIVSFKTPGLDLARISVENLDGLVIIGAVDGGKVLTSVGELDFFTGFKRNFFVVFYLIVMQNDAHHFEFVLEAYHQEQSGGMDTDAVGFFGENFAAF